MKRITSKIVVTAAIFLHLLLMITALAQAGIVEDLELRGYRKISRETLLQHIKTRPGDKFSDDQVKRDLEALIKLDCIDPLKIAVQTTQGPRGGKVVIFMIAEKKDCQ